MTIRESEAVILREVVRRLLDGESSRSIVMDLRRRVVKTSTGKDWHGHTIQRIISSPRICGILTHLGTHCKAQWPAILSSEDWQRVQVVWRARARHGTTAPRRYRCARDEAYYHRSGCGRIFRVAEPIDLLVSEAVLRRLGSPDFIRALGAQANNGELKAKIDERQPRKTTSASCSTTEPAASSLRQVWEEADLDFKRDLKLLVKKIVILPGRTQRLCTINEQTFRFDPSLMRIIWEV